MLLIYEDESVYGDKNDTPEMRDIVAKHWKLVGELGDQRKAGAGLQPTATATTVRTANGRQTIHDGPFAETREQLGGFYVIEAADLDEAIAIARRVPVRSDGAIEVRPLLPPPPGA
jgi:hypothetical protein